MKKILFYLIAIGAGLFLLFFVITCLLIGHSVRNHCRLAQEKYGGDCVESLIPFLDDENNGFKDRNSAIWALGQLGDSRALPVLQKYFTGSIPAKEPFGQSISQYELKKAVNLASGGFNLSAIIWRIGF